MGPALRDGIRNGSDIGYERLKVRFAQRISPPRHERRFVQRCATIRDNRREIGIAHLVQRIAFRERMRLDVEIVKV